jgi:hypothetical protein
MSAATADVRTMAKKTNSDEQQAKEPQLFRRNEALPTKAGEIVYDAPHRPHSERSDRFVAAARKLLG